MKKLLIFVLLSQTVLAQSPKPVLNSTRHEYVVTDFTTEKGVVLPKAMIDEATKRYEARKTGTWQASL